MLNLFKLLALAIIIITPVNTTVACSSGKAQADKPTSAPVVVTPLVAPNYPLPSGKQVLKSSAVHVHNSNLYNVMALNPSSPQLANNFKQVRVGLLQKLKITSFSKLMQARALGEGNLLKQKAKPKLVSNFEKNLWNKNFDNGVLAWQQSNKTLTERLKLLSSYIQTYNANVSLDFNSLFNPAYFTLSNTVKQNYQAGILKFYNFLFNYLGPLNTSHLLKSLNGEAQGSGSAVAATVFDPANEAQKIVFYGDTFAKQNMINTQYYSGWWSSNNLLEVFVHEVGHAIANFLHIAPRARQYFNSTLPSSGSRLIFNSKDPNNYINDYLGQTFVKPAKDNVAKALNTYAIVQSNYSRIASYGVRHFPEVFAESFAEWLLPSYTIPSSEQGIYDHNYSWSLIDSFYTNKLRQFFKLTKQ